jgi:hypothetical protein
MKTVKQIASELNSQFHEQTRTNGEKFWSLKPDNYDQYIDAVRDIHGTDMLPDDWRYSMIVSILDKIKEYDAETVEDFEDTRHEIIDGLVDIYNQDRLNWLASNLCRSEYVDEAVSEFGWPEKEGIYQAIAYGQYREIEELFNNIMNYLSNTQESERTA